jgi:hypothetical protein
MNIGEARLAINGERELTRQAGGTFVIKRSLQCPMNI